MKKKKRKQSIDIHKEFTHNAWWIPFRWNKEYGCRLDGRNRQNTLFKCDKCDRVYSYDCVNQKYPAIYYYRELPKRQRVKTCQQCDGKKVTTYYI